MYYGYILYSRFLDRYYVGSSQDLIERLKKHLNNHNGFTAKAKDWIIVFSIPFQTRAEALRWEKSVKRKKSRSYIEWLIKNGLV